MLAFSYDLMVFMRSLHELSSSRCRSDKHARMLACLYVFKLPQSMFEFHSCQVLFVSFPLLLLGLVVDVLFVGLRGDDAMPAAVIVGKNLKIIII